MKNQVLSDGHRKSQNFFASDKVLKHFLRSQLSEDAQKYMNPFWLNTGLQAATEMDALSMAADKHAPELIKRNAYGETVDEIRFHPAYDRLLEIAVESRMMAVKWVPQTREKFLGNFHSMGFAAGYLFALSESGQYCPLCMTDGVARLVDRFCETDDKHRLLPGIYAAKKSDFLTGAMFLTEKAGGSDVGANLVRATHISGKEFSLSGEKWFCSNVNADIIFVLARIDDQQKGTRGLSIFLVEPTLPDGSRNPLGMVRLKDKLGVRSMASAECVLDGTRAKLVGEENQGFAIMAEMINLSRLYNSVAALSASRRALVEAYQFLSFRNTFGKNALEHALVRDKFLEIGALQVANFYLVWRAIRALDEQEAGSGRESELLRLLTPMVKKWSAETSVYIVRESMELMGGMGYIEDTVLPKIMRDVMVLPIWEGAGNIMVLDMLRANHKSEGLAVLMEEIEQAISQDGEEQALLQAELEDLKIGFEGLAHQNRDQQEWMGKQLFAQLTHLYQISLMLRFRDTESEEWIAPALTWMYAKLDNQQAPLLSLEQINGLIAWEF